MLIRLSLISSALFALAVPVHAGEAPSLVGTWKGIADNAVMLGGTPYRKGKPNDKVTFADEPIEFTFEIGEQKGPRFAGTLKGLNKTETLIGYLHADGKSGQMLDDDGEYSFTLSDQSTMEVCYSHTKPDSKVIACWTARRPME
jgi:hypothetical protein